MNITTRKDVRTKPNGREHLDVKYYVDISINVNDNPKASLSKDVHGLPIDLLSMSRLPIIKTKGK